MSGDDFRKTTPAPASPAQLAFAEAGKRALEARQQLARAIRRHPSVRLALADVKAAQEGMARARDKVRP